jgi:DNA-binding LytR/AlgR family response regulator
VIFTTTYSQYAIEGFDLEIVDFLLKPFSYERFSKAVNKAKEKLNARGVSSVSARISVKADRRIYQISIDDILYVEACGDYVSVYCTDKKLVVHGTLKCWEEKLGGFAFLKVHRTILVSLQRINHIEGNLIVIGTHKVPVSESFRQNLFDQMLGQPLQ